MMVARPNAAAITRPMAVPAIVSSRFHSLTSQAYHASGTLRSRRRPFESSRSRDEERANGVGPSAFATTRICRCTLLHGEDRTITWLGGHCHIAGHHDAP